MNSVGYTRRTKTEEASMYLRVGVIGCGNISDIYLTNAPQFKSLKYIACADLRDDAAAKQANQYGLRHDSIKGLLAAADIDVVLNLTVPNAHYEVSAEVLRSGKHVYSEKPVSSTVEEGRSLLTMADNLGLRVGGAPDIILGPSTQLAKSLVSEGQIGEVVTAVSCVMGRGMEHWHPNPAFFYQKGGGPVLDVGPYNIASLTAILGPVRSVRATGRIGSPERLITAPGAAQGTTIKVETLTSVNALLTFCCGAEATFLASWDVWNHGMRPTEIHGTRGSLRVPHPNWFDGTIEIYRDTKQEWVFLEPGPSRMAEKNYYWFGGHYANYRGAGLADMARAILDGRPHRCSGRFALHTLAVLTGIIESAESGSVVELQDTCDIPASLTDTEADNLFIESPVLPIGKPS
jgi:predicted dehydrogenase